MSTGTSKVIAMNHRDRTRSKYSRLATTKIFLSMTRHPGFYGARADALNEHLMERRLHQLESLDARSGVHEPPEQRLRIRVGRQLDLVESIVFVEALHETRIAQDRADAIQSAVGQ